jgi:hypothetical protein
VPRPISFRLSRAGLFAVLGALVAVSLTAELTSYARPDIGFLLDAAGRVLDGAKLYVDIVEINPPLIIVLNFPAVLLARALHLSPILVYRLGFAVALLVSLWLTARRLRAVLPDDAGLQRLLLALVAFALFPLSAQDFGQREHLLLALATPYLLLGVARALGRPVDRREAMVLGLLAGVGFALKPHFLLLWIAVEAYLRFAPGRPRPAWGLPPESVGISLILITYGTAIFTLTPDYLRLVRLVAGAYSEFLHASFLHLLVTGPGAALSLFALLAYVALRRRAGHIELWNLLALGVLACFLAGAAQQKGLRYHFYPSFALGLAMLGLAAADAREPLQRGVQRIYRAIALAVVVAAVVVVTVQNVAQAAGFAPRDEQARFGELVRLVRAHASTPGDHLYVMSYHIGSTYPLVNYSGVPSASRFPQLWILAAEYLDDLNADRPLRYHAPAEMSPSERYLNQAVLEDLERQPPKVLIVLRHARDLPVNGYRRLNYLAYFGRDPRLAAILDRYQWIGDVGDYAAYERLADGQPRTGPPPAAAPGTHDVIRTDREGLHLRLQDSTFLFAIVAFALALVFAVRRERSGIAGM